MRTSFWIVVWLLVLGTFGHAQNWYESLWPGITRTEIHNIAGRPSRSTPTVDVYLQSKGRIECTYEGSNLVKATYFDTPDGAESADYYEVQKGSGHLNNDERSLYLKRKDFFKLPQFGGSFVSTRKYKGQCFKIDDGYLVVEPMMYLLGSGGYFVDKIGVARWIGSDHKETIVYRASDHWDRLRPPDVSESDVKSRETRLLAAGDRSIGMKIGDLFGSPGGKRVYSIQNAPYCRGITDFPESDYIRQTLGICNERQCDGFGGSGIFREFFYLDDGLAVVFPIGEDVVSRITIARPGLVHSLTLDEWLAEHRK